MALITFSASFINQNQKSGLVKGVSIALEKSSPRQEIYFGSPGLSYDEMLKQNQVVVYPEDIVAVFPDPSLNLGSRIVINRAYRIIVNDGGQQQDYRTWQKDVTGFLSEKGIQVGPDDVVNVGLDQAISDNLHLQIIRVAQNEVTETIPIPYQTIKKNDPDLLVGETKIEKAGQEGIREKRYKIRRENGQITEKILLEDKLINNPQDKIVRVGTRKKMTVSCAGYDSLIEDAAAKNNLDPNSLCRSMIRESNGHPNSYNPSGPYSGLFQYTDTFWSQASTLAGYADASIWDAKAQIYVTAWAWAHGYRGRWP